MERLYSGVLCLQDPGMIDARGMVLGRFLVIVTNKVPVVTFTQPR